MARPGDRTYQHKTHVERETLLVRILALPEREQLQIHEALSASLGGRLGRETEGEKAQECLSYLQANYLLVNEASILTSHQHEIYFSPAFSYPWSTFRAAASSLSLHPSGTMEAEGGAARRAEAQSGTNLSRLGRPKPFKFSK